MKLSKNKIYALIAMLLMLSFVVTPLALPAAIAQTASSPIPTNAYVTVSPNPTGLNQQVTFEMWMPQLAPTAGGVFGSAYSGGSWTNYKLLITKPDGTQLTLGPFTSDPSAAAEAYYTPTVIGTYNVTFSFPGQHVVGPNFIGVPVDLYYGGSSFTTTFTVQQQPVSPSPQTPLPTSYWTRPINAQNQEWYQISGNWLGTGAGEFGTSTYDINGNFNPYTLVSDSPHIMWTKPIEFGGLIGGEFGNTTTSNYYNGKNYEPAFTPPVILNGVLYYNSPTPPREGFYAVDLSTGKTLWYQNNTATISNGQVENFISPNQEGGIPYLWSIQGTTWYMYDANTGNLILKIANATPAPTIGLGSTPGGVESNIVEGSNGELLFYVLDGTNNWLAMWNSTLCILSSPGSSDWSWRPQTGGTLNWENGIQWNVTTPSYPGQAINRINDGVILATTGNYFFRTGWQMEIGYSMTTGQQLWVQNRTLFAGAITYGLMGPVADGVYTEFHITTMQWYGYSIYTGEQLWGPSEAYTNPWGSIPSDDIFAQSAYGILYAQSVDGIHALNITTGQTLWTFYAANSGANFPGFSTYPFETNMLFTIADGKVIASTGGSHGNPEFRGANLYVIDAFTGKQLWSINGYFEQSLPVADGYLIGFNLYDNQLYAFGMGPSKTTVTAPDIGVTTATPITITGTVMDISAGSQQNAVAANFPNGLPCVSDASMSQFMEAVYMQQPMPTNITGVPVTLTETDHNGNTYTIGTTTTNTMGVYGFNWTPPIPGNYTIVATFAGSNSYYGSSASTYIYASSPAATAAPTASPPTGLASTGTVMLGVAVLAIIIIVCVAVLAILMLRKRP
jgi:hypothetical protein